MNICIVTENYIRGGLNTFLWSLIDGWPNCNDEFTIIVNQEFPSPENLFFDCKKKVNIIYYSKLRSYPKGIRAQQPPHL